MPYSPVLATLGYVFAPDSKRILMIHRNARTDDSHFGIYNGLGGKLEPGEDIVSGMKREIREEATIECTRLELAGTISWPGFGRNGEDWFGFIFRILNFNGIAAKSNSEGDLEWIEVEKIDSLPLWEGDRHFLPMVLERGHPQFHGVMPYRDGHPLSWSYSLLE